MQYPIFFPLQLNSFGFGIIFRNWRQLFEVVINSSLWNWGKFISLWSPWKCHRNE